MKRLLYIPVVLSLMLFSGCGKHENNEAWQSLPEDSQTLFFVNEFGYNMIATYYLWNKEIARGLDTWAYNVDPISKVREIRYKDSNGKDIDKWTQMTDDYESFQGKVAGNSKSTGMEYALYYADETKQNVVIVVTFTYPDSPAALAGLKRGDVIVALNGDTVTPDNYKSLLSSTLLGENTTVITMDDGREVSLTPKQMYMDPVNCHKLILKDDRRIGYLHYTNFTLKSAQRLVDVFKEFKAQGITELVLDLRYNSGGYSLTSELLASMIVPVKEVNNNSVFMRDVYNSILTEAWGEEKSLFRTEFEITDDGVKYNVSTSGANPGISKLHVIITGSSASASESTICGLIPYMNVDLTGERSAGKYCGGFIVDGPTWFGWVKDELSKNHYEKGVELTSNWGIYVMVSRYADRDGKTLSMPDGIAPDYEIGDNPLDGYQLGDVNETMLSVAISGKAPEAGLKASVRPKKELLKMENQLPRVPMRIITPEKSL